MFHKIHVGNTFFEILLAYIMHCIQEKVLCSRSLRNRMTHLLVRHFNMENNRNIIFLYLIDKERNSLWIGLSIFRTAGECCMIRKTILLYKIQEWETVTDDDFFPFTGRNNISEIIIQGGEFRYINVCIFLIRGCILSID